MERAPHNCLIIRGGFYQILQIVRWVVILIGGELHQKVKRPPANTACRVLIRALSLFENYDVNVPVHSGKVTHHKHATRLVRIFRLAQFCAHKPLAQWLPYDNR